jgi:ParB-like chromosome segregation protein Spo0J
MKDPDHKIVFMPVAELQGYKQNARQHGEDQIAALMKSIKSFGFTAPVMISDEGTIIAGHGRVEAARRLHYSTVPCIRLSNLTEAQQKAYVIADNQLASMATWDWDMLAAEIDNLKDQDFDISTLGFTKEQLDEMLGSPDEIPEIADEKVEKPDKDTAICPKCHHEFVL